LFCKFIPSGIQTFTEAIFPVRVRAKFWKNFVFT
jgi:hypothetical protein